MPEFAKRELKSDQPLGSQLKAVRRTAELNLEQVSAVTKIHKKFLVALEEGSYDAFPAEVYARGFLESYAAFLGFPADEALLQYQRERGLEGVTKAQPMSHVPRQAAGQSRYTITPRTIGVGLGALSFLIGAGFIVAQVTGFASPPKLVIYKPEPSAVLGSETVEVEGKTDAGAELTINSQPIPTDPGGGFKEQVRLPSGSSTVRIAAKNKRGRERIITRSVVVQTVATPAPVATPPATAAGLLMTVKIGPNSAYLTAVVDDKTAFQGVLSPGTEQTFLATTRILITSGNAGSTQVFINGQDQGPLGREGQLRKGVEYLVTPTPPPAAPAPAAPPPAS